MSVESTTVFVDLAERSYEIRIGLDNLADIGRWVESLGDISQTIVITDSNVRQLYGETVLRTLSTIDTRIDIITVPAGEASKSIPMLDEILNQMLSLQADRKSLVLALGGGVVGDLAGFAAATYGRGIRFLQIPTTLLATVDSSVGGKVGINLPGAKNMVGAFWQPQGVLVDVNVLQSLPERDYRAGLAEVIKYGVIQDVEFFGKLEAHADLILTRDPVLMRDIIARCCQLKAEVVTEDERETTGRRAILNYGHTFCHALESCTGYGQFLHGEAVAIGMLCASRLAESLEMIDADITQRQFQLLTKFGLPTDVPADLNRQELVEAMQHDKKTEHGKLRFILPVAMGHVQIVDDIDSKLVQAALN